MAIELHFQKTFTLPKRKLLKAFIEHLVKAEAYTLDHLSIVFCSDEYLLEMNKQHLAHDYYTDIITFDLRNNLTLHTIDGELYISVDRVHENAKQHKILFLVELHRVIFHGILHLIGYGDKTPSQIKKMRSKEDEYLDQISMFHVEHKR